MLRPNLQLAIQPFMIEGEEARYVIYEPANESLSSFGYLGADKRQVASRTIILGTDDELTEENILAKAGVKLVVSAPAPAKAAADTK